MENASKALIIAGSILVAILIVTLGIFLISNSKGTSESAKNTATELQTGADSTVDTLKTALESNEDREIREFNKQFEEYRINSKIGTELESSFITNMYSKIVGKTPIVYIISNVEDDVYPALHYTVSFLYSEGKNIPVTDIMSEYAGYSGQPEFIFPVSGYIGDITSNASENGYIKAILIKAK